MTQRVFIIRENGDTEGPFENHSDEFFGRIEEIRDSGERQLNFIPADLICDFCGRTPVLWCYQIEAGGIIGQSGPDVHYDRDGQWGACQGCRDFIAWRDERGLLQRAIDGFKELNPEKAALVPDTILLVSMAGPHRLFWSRYDGTPPEPVTPDADWLASLGIGD